MNRTIKNIHAQQVFSLEIHKFISLGEQLTTVNLFLDNIHAAIQLFFEVLTNVDSTLQNNVFR